MFNGVPVEQFHQFISTPATRIIPPSPNSSSNHNMIQTPSTTNPCSSSSSSNLNNFLSFDHHPVLFPPSHPSLHQNLFQNNQFLRPPPTQQDHHGLYTNIITAATTHHETNNNKLDDEEMGDIKEDDDDDDSWSTDEVLQLLKIKSSSESWFRDFTWDHVSRKLAEMGCKKSAEKCKDKFEEETCRSFGNTIGGYNKNTTTRGSRYLITEELDEHLYNNSAHAQNAHPPVPVRESPDHHNVIEHEQVPPADETDGQDENLDARGQKGHFEKDLPTEITMMAQQDVEHVAKSKKRKRKHKKFKMVKGLCIELVNRMMAQQEEMHRKLLQDMAIRDEEKIKREEAWRKEEMERVQREIQIREQEQEMARNRQSTITEFLNKITSFDQKIQIPSDINLQDLQNVATNIDRPSGTTKTPCVQKFAGNRNQDHPTLKDDLGKRWPRDEVLALINIRSKVNGGIGVNSEEHQGYTCNDKGGGSLWERISQGMLEVGYKRSAKRCKEKWENINKYFRKTKDANKKRSLDSRTCPYYHELNKLYNQEKAFNSGRASSDETENCPRPTITPGN